jgi:hypothetical protein
MLHSAALTELDLQIKRTQRFLKRDRLLAATALTVTALFVWLAIALFGLPSRLPALAETLLSLAVLAFLGWTLWRGLNRYRTPTRDEARNALAIACALEPAAFDILEDRPVQMDAAGLAFWRAARADAVQEAMTARPKLRFTALRAADPFDLRHGAMALALIAALVAGPEGPERLARALLPSPGPLVGDGRLTLEAWATPAAYTNAAAISLTDQTGQTVVTPPSITVTLRAQGLAGAPVLVFDPDQGPTQRITLTKAADGAYEGELDIPGQGTLRLVRFHTVARWRLEPAIDKPPTAVLTAPPTAGEGEDLTIAWSATDDFGVHAIGLSVRPVDPPPGLADAAPSVTLFEGPAGDPLSASGESAVDLAEHPYAGMKVELRLLARDSLGQDGLSEPVELVMPEKIFLQPLARATLEIRRTILWERHPYTPARPAPGGPIFLQPAPDGLLGTEPLLIETDDQFPTLERAPAAIRRAVRLLDALTMAPEDGYFTDPAVFMGLRFARERLARASEIEETDATAAILWEIALRAEYGSSADASRALQQAQRALNDALARGEPADRIQRLTDALRQATESYLQALVAEALTQPPQNRADTEEQTEMSGQDIEQMLNEVERLSQDGQNQQAQQMLQALSQLLQNLEVHLADGPGANPNGQGTEPGEGDPASGLNNAMRDQRSLNEETQAQGAGSEGTGQEGTTGEGEQGDQQAADGTQGDGEGQPNADLAQRQRGLRESLAAARNQAGQAAGPDNQNLEAADEAMDRAAQALERGDFEQASAAQEEALERLAAGTEQAEDKLRNQQQGRGSQDAAGSATDPLGRISPAAGSNAGDQDADPIPAEVQRARSRAIMDELRRRAQDQSRSQEERDYLNRLLERFNGS